MGEIIKKKVVEFKRRNYCWKSRNNKAKCLQKKIKFIVIFGGGNNWLHD